MRPAITSGVKSDADETQDQRSFSPVYRSRPPTSLNIPTVLFQAYRELLDQSPVLTKAITSGVVAGVSDVISQVIVQRANSGEGHYSWRSTIAFSAFSMVVTGPVTHYLYQFLEATFPNRSTKYSVVKKVIADRLLFAPPYLLALFYCVARMEGKSHLEAWQKVKTVFWPALARNLVVWGIAQYINMSYVTVQYRVLFGNLVAFLWNIYLAILRR